MAAPTPTNTAAATLDSGPCFYQADPTAMTEANPGGIIRVSANDHVTLQRLGSLDHDDIIRRFNDSKKADKAINNDDPFESDDEELPELETVPAVAEEASESTHATSSSRVKYIHVGQATTEPSDKQKMLQALYPNASRDAALVNVLKKPIIVPGSLRAGIPDTFGDEMIRTRDMDLAAPVCQKGRELMKITSDVVARHFAANNKTGGSAATQAASSVADMTPSLVDGVNRSQTGRLKFELKCSLIAQEYLEQTHGAHGMTKSNCYDMIPDHASNGAPARPDDMPKLLSVRQHDGSMKRGALIVLEGLDRAGKSTQAQMLVDALCQGYELSDTHPTAILMRFPNRTTTIGKLIDAYLKQSGEHVDDHAIHLLFSGDRWNARATILEALARGQHVVLDRYVYSGIAYSVAKERPDLSRMWASMPDCGLPAPDLVCFLDITPEQAAARGGFGTERYEQTDMQRKVGILMRDFQHNPPFQNPIPWVPIDASKTLDQVHAVIMHCVERMMDSYAPAVGTLDIPLE